MPALEKLFDRLAGPDTVIRLDRVEIDLGPIYAQLLDRDDLGQRLAEQCEKSILNALQTTHHRNSQQIPAQINRCEEWLHWLQHGQLPWHSTTPGDDWFRSVLDTLGVDTTAIVRLRQILRLHPTALKRLAWQHSEPFLLTLLALYTGRKETRLEKILLELRQILTGSTPAITPGEIRQLELCCWETTLLEVVVEGKMWKETFFEAVLRRASPAVLAALNAIKNITPGRQTKYPALKALLKNNPLPSSQSEPTPGPEAESLPKPSLYVQPSEAIFVRHAGIVLLHPFLSRLFNKLGLLDGAAFKNFTARNKAILLLHCAATGALQAPDHALVLPKLLCDCPLNLPLDFSLSITPAEREETDQALRAAISHWRALGTASPDGLRETFLQRDGKLEHRQGNWRLRIEKKTIDILLDRLPWNISALNLPWMPEALYVDWN